MRLDERGPGRLPLSLGSLFNAVPFENIADRRVENMRAEIGQSTLDVIGTTTLSLLGKPLAVGE